MHKNSSFIKNKIKDKHGSRITTSKSKTKTEFPMKTLVDLLNRRQNKPEYKTTGDFPNLHTTINVERERERRFTIRDS